MFRIALISVHNSGLVLIRLDHRSHYSYPSLEAMSNSMAITSDDNTSSHTSNAPMEATEKSVQILDMNFEYALNKLDDSVGAIARR
jgi:hypothetical protein